MPNNDKNRKSEIQERFDEADNNGRFAGNDEDARKAKQSMLDAGAKDTTGYDSGAKPNTGTGNADTNDQHSDREAHRNPQKTQDYKGEAQNVSDGNSRPMGDDQQEIEHARNKAHSGSKNRSNR